MVRISIIGTCGRSNQELLTQQLFFDMIVKVIDIIDNEFKLDTSEVILVSGGAAWSDHIAVKLFNEGAYPNLELNFPTYFRDGKFINNNTGNTSNMYHKVFSGVCDINSLEEISEAISNNCSIRVGKGFLDRNNYVADCDYMIAFTFNNGDIPAKGGTLDTWNKCKSVKKHVNLYTLL